MVTVALPPTCLGKRIEAARDRPRAWLRRAKAGLVRLSGLLALIALPIALTSNVAPPAPIVPIARVAALAPEAVAEQQADPLLAFATGLPPPPGPALLLNAARSIEAAPLASAPFHYVGSQIDRTHASDCLAAAAWYEAGDDPAGERAVIQVVLNRVRHPAYPKSVCGVVLQGSELPTGCQFTFTCDGALRRKPGAAAWLRAKRAADAALAGSVDPLVGGATHYHAEYVYPWWAPHLRKLAIVGPHVFYRFAHSRQFDKAAELVSVQPEQVSSKLHATLRGAGPEERASEPPRSPSTDLAVSYADLADTAEPPAVAANGLLTFHVDPSQPSGRWALLALARCSGKRDCRAIARPLPGDNGLGRTLPLTSRPLLVFVRDSIARTQIVLWDCAATARPEQRECLPTNADAIARLLKLRSGSDLAAL